MSNSRTDYQAWYSSATIEKDLEYDGFLCQILDYPYLLVI